MTEQMRNFAVGLASIIALVGFAAILMLFGELEGLTARRYVVTVHMNAAGGLRIGSPVELNGVPVGSVQEIHLQPVDEYPVRLITMVDQSVRIRTPVDGNVQLQLIAGTAVLELTTKPPPPGEVAGELPRDGTAEVFIHHLPLLEQIAAELDARTEPFKRAVDQFERLSETYIAVGENLNLLIQPQDRAAIEAGEPPNLHAAVVRFHDIIDETQIALRLAQNWLGDEELRHEIRDAVVNARRLIEDAAATLGQVGGFVEQLEDRTDEVIARLVPMADNLAVLFEEIRMITRLATEGDGTVAQLLHNPDLYNSLDDAAIRFEQALRELQLFIQKVSAEGLPMRWF